MKKILFIWDFHGVLEKGNEYALQDVLNQVMEEFGIPRKVGMEKVLELYGMSWFDYYCDICGHQDEQILEKMIMRSNEIGLKAAQKYVKPMDYAKEVLQKIRLAGGENIVVSNSTPENIRLFADLVGLSSLFDKCIGVESGQKNNMSGAKMDAVKKYLTERKFDKIVCIGDNEHDIEAGQHFGATTYLFSTNHDAKTKADFVISDLREVLREL
jgi:phosphoglycolate phosphatase-like HAD superfamily hydrolase